MRQHENPIDLYFPLLLLDGNVVAQGHLAEHGLNFHLMIPEPSAQLVTVFFFSGDISLLCVAECRNFYRFASLTFGDLNCDHVQNGPWEFWPFENL